MNDHRGSLKSESQNLLIHDGKVEEFRELCQKSLERRSLNPKEFRILGNDIMGSIGHISEACGTRAKALILGLDSNKYYLIYSKCANIHLVENYLSEYFPILQVSDWQHEMLRTTKARLFESMNYFDEDAKARLNYEYSTKVSLAWNQMQGPGKPLLTTTDDDLLYAQEILNELDSANNYPYIVLHVRNTSSSIRNASLIDYLEMIELANDSGIGVVFIGDRVQIPEKISKLPRFLNYSTSHLRSERADVALIASCFGFVGTTSGPTWLASLFGKRIIWTNAIGHSAFTYLPNAICIPKRFYKNFNHVRTLVSFHEMSADPQVYFAENILPEYLSIQDNSPLELKETFEEVFLSKSGKSDPFLVRTEKLTQSKTTISKSFQDRYPRWFD